MKYIKYIKEYKEDRQYKFIGETSGSILEYTGKLELLRFTEHEMDKIKAILPKNVSLLCTDNEGAKVYSIFFNDKKDLLGYIGTIGKYFDEYYIVSLHIKGVRGWYLCDEFKGLLNCLEEIHFII